MLDIYERARFCFGRSYQGFFLLVFLSLFSNLRSIEKYQDGLSANPRHCEHEWVSRYFNSLPNDVDDPVSDEDIEERLRALQRPSE
ncbi:MAG TPA: hypothetical protein VLF61_00650 [Rhabdochlamydiaceae bacterium]|nr:hypothetical protein [Rhabdochlamydiaceae bacterium]